MKQEQLADNVTLYCGDCRDIIPTLPRVNAVVSDPPYGIQELVGDRGYGRQGNLDRKTKTEPKIANDKNLDVVTEVFELIRTSQIKIKNWNAWVAAFYSCRITPDFFKAMENYSYFGEVVWDKKAPGLGSQIRYQHENVAFFKIGKPEMMTDTASVLSYAAVKGATATIVDDVHGKHPHEKPHQVMVNIVNMVPGDLILDPFMGTGSTGAACVELRRGFIGCELNEKYFDIAVKKIGAALKQPVAFWE